jgi:hypothetical protein
MAQNEMEVLEDDRVTLNVTKDKVVILHPPTTLNVEFVGILICFPRLVNMFQ